MGGTQTSTLVLTHVPSLTDGLQTGAPLAAPRAPPGQTPLPGWICTNPSHGGSEVPLIQQPHGADIPVFLEAALMAPILCIYLGINGLVLKSGRRAGCASLPAALGSQAGPMQTVFLCCWLLTLLLAEVSSECNYTLTGTYLF